MKRTEELKITVEEAERFTRMLNEPDDDNGRDEPVFDREVVFDNGIRAAIQVIASTEPDKEPCWSQVVLFEKVGYELACTDVGEDLLGEWHLYDGDDEYEVVVTTDMRDEFPNGKCPDCETPISRTCVNGEACGNCGHVFWTKERARQELGYQRDIYEVVCGNIGTVYSGNNPVEARRVYGIYKQQSESGCGRAGGEDVTLMKDGEPSVEYFGAIARGEAQENGG